MEQKLLFEELSPSEAGIMVESATDGSKHHWLSGVFMQADIKNRNGRVYPIQEITKAVQDASIRIQESNGIFGELDHPQTLNVNLDRISHAITDLKMEGANAIGRAKLLDTPMGMIAQELVKSEVKLGVSSRGAGAVSEGTNGVVSGFQFVTVDLVASPSAPGAIPTTVFESLDLYKNGHNIIDLSEAVREDKRAQHFFEKEIEKWLRLNIFEKK